MTRASLQRAIRDLRAERDRLKNVIELLETLPSDGEGASSTMGRRSRSSRDRGVHQEEHAEREQQDQGV